VRVKPTTDPEPKGVGRPHTLGTVLARIMSERRIPVSRISAILHVSDRTMHNYLRRLYPIPVLHMAALCDYLDVDPDEIVDAGNVLLEDQRAE